MVRTRLLISAIVVMAMIPVIAVLVSRASAEDAASACVVCHSQATPGVVAQWRESKHGKAGMDCAVCHQSNEGEPGAKKHFGDSVIIPVISPKVCGRCHAQQTREFTASHHAAGAKFIGSLDNILGEMVEGGPAANTGCKQCHGSTVRVMADGSLDSATWPNSGIGRINPDGSNGACSSCHARHTFSLAQAREPDTCGRCHLGPDHPQLEVFNESKHGILFRANRDKMNMSAKPWVAGKDYSAAPTCATCHVSATPHQPVTHDIGARISWTLRPAVSTKLDKWESRREAMQGVCRQCHSASYVSNFYKQYDSAVDLYNEKFAKPATAAMDKLRAEKLLTETPFDEKIEWTYYLMWHHDGRSARHGASMLGPDYVQWHGFFELANRFYNEFVPELRELKPALADELLAGDDHKWTKGIPKEEREKIIQYYKDRYGN